MPPVLGSRTCRWATVAPAFAALRAESAISCGVTGTFSFFSTVSPAPVIAAVSITFLVKTTDLRCHRSEEHTSELQSRFDLVCRLLLEKKIIDLNGSIRSEAGGPVPLNEVR